MPREKPPSYPLHSQQRRGAGRLRSSATPHDVWPDPPPRSRSSARSSGFPIGVVSLGMAILGAFTAGAWQVWQFVTPMLETPPLPKFDQALKPSPRLTRIPESTPSPSVLPTGGSVGQRGRVIEPLGLAIRSEPDGSSAYLGGIVVGETVTVLQMSADGRWQRVRRELNGQEGWVRSGNLGPADRPPPRVAASPQAVPSPPARPAAGQGRAVTGLSLRSEPGGQRVSGIPANEIVTVLGTSPDGRWQQVRRQNGEQGWVRAGNLSSQ